MVFHWSLSDSKSPQVPKTLLSILAVLNNAVVWMVSTRPPTSQSSSPSSNPLVTVPNAPIIIGIIVICMFHWFFNYYYYYYHYYYYYYLFVYFLEPVIEFIQETFHVNETDDYLKAGLKRKGKALLYPLQVRAFACHHVPPNLSADLPTVRV